MSARTPVEAGQRIEPSAELGTVELGLLEVAPDAVVVCDAGGRIVQVNAKAEGLSGQAREQLLGAQVGELLAGGLGADSHSLIRADGTELPVDVNWSEVEAASGPVRIAIVRDASRRRRIEEELRRSHARLSEAQELARLGSWEWDIPGNRVIWSDELYRIYGFEPQSFAPTYEKFLGCVHPDDQESVDARNRKAFADHEPFEDIKRIVRPDGSEFLMRTQGEVVVGDDGNPLRMIGVCEDVTDRVRAQQAEARLAEIIQTANDAIYTTDVNDIVTSWNPGAERLYGYSAAEMLGRSIDVLLTEADRSSGARERMRSLIFSGARSEPIEVARRRKTGELIEVSVTISTIRNSEGDVIGGSTIARDITERRRIEAKLEYLANHDALTGLFNRRRFEEELTAACARAARDGVAGALLLLDLDSFKYINDTLGHHAGDELLTEIAGALQARVRATDSLARLGGDEFAVLAAPCTLAQAQELSRALLSAVREVAMNVEGQTVSVTASAGVVAFDSETEAAELLASADRAMYESKDAGRDRTTVHSAEQRRRSLVQMRVSWEHQIRDALENDRFELYCQPILELATGDTTQAEVLLRLHSGDEVILPGAFLPAAERSGLIHAVDRWVISRAIAAAAAHPDMRFEINLSGRTTDDEQLPGFVAEQLACHGANPANLVFELTETAAIGNIGRARELARGLAEVGCTFAIDDFGAGFSTFYYLKHFPTQYLKIDGEFVSAPRSRTDELVIESIVRIAQDLGKRTIAEFVTSAETLQRMRELGVDYAQGFHIAEPFPLSQLPGYAG